MGTCAMGCCGAGCQKLICMKRTRTPLSLPLAAKNAHARDACITFDEGAHVYYVERNGVVEKAPTSATKFAEHYFEGFDAIKIINKYFEGWRHDPCSRYFEMIHAALANGNEESAKAEIAAHWQKTAISASAAGTTLHNDCELVCNGFSPLTNSKEIEHLCDWLTNFQPEQQWEPYRTEWRLWYEDVHGELVLAGTPDLVVRSRATGEYALVDFKRTDPKGRAMLLQPGISFPKFAKPPLSEVEDSKFGKYECQLNVLSFILRERYGIDVGNRMFILQLHDSLDTWHCVQVTDRQDAIQSLFRIEHTRLRGSTVRETEGV